MSAEDMAEVGESTEKQRSRGRWRKKQLQEGGTRIEAVRRDQKDEGNIITRPFLGFAKYLSEVRDELQKVSWPTRQEVVYLTRIVVAITVVISIALGIITLIFTELFNYGLDHAWVLSVVVILGVLGSIYYIFRENRSSSSY